MVKASYEGKQVSIQPTETLLSLTEIAVAVLGFAGILAVMKGSQREVIPGVNQWRLEALVVYGTNAIAFSLVPVLVLSMDFPDSAIWAVGSLLSAIVVLVWLAWAFKKQKKYFSSYFPEQTLWNDALIIVFCTFCIGAGVDNVFTGGLFNQSFGGYLFSIAPWFYVAVMAFLRSILTINLGGESA
jgi:hypothetical protein